VVLTLAALPAAEVMYCRASDWKEQVWVGKLQVVTRDRVGEAAVKLVNPETGKARGPARAARGQRRRGAGCWTRALV
jgi:hypothetical protein